MSRLFTIYLTRWCLTITQTVANSGTSIKRGAEGSTGIVHYNEVSLSASRLFTIYLTNTGRGCRSLFIPMTSALYRFVISTLHSTDFHEVRLRYRPFSWVPWNIFLGTVQVRSNLYWNYPLSWIVKKETTICPEQSRIISRARNEQVFLTVSTVLFK